MGRRTVTLVATVALGVVLAGCSGTTQFSERQALSRDAGGAALAEPAPRASAAPGDRAASQQQSTAPELAAETKIRTAELSVTVADRAAVAARADQAASLAERVGGEVDSEDRGETYATLRLRVPPAELAGALRTLSGYGRATSREVSVRDVTARVADVSSRVRSAEQAIARLRALYTTAGRVTDVIAIEQQLTSREADLESLQAQQRALAAQTSLATITLQLRAGTAAPPKADDRSGFLGGLARGWDAFTGAVAGVATGVGAALPFLVLLALLAVVGRIAWRRTRRPRLDPQPAPD